MMIPIEVPPVALLAYEQAQSNGYKGTLADFLDDEIIKYFKEKSK